MHGNNRIIRECGSGRDRPDQATSLGVQVPTHGLLNVVAAPHLSEGSTYRAVFTQPPSPKGGPTAAGEGSRTPLDR